MSNIRVPDLSQARQARALADADEPPTLAAEECLEHGEECSGAVEYRMALSATGKSFPRCEAHWEKRLAEQEQISQRYPDSPCAPAWFDSQDAGESWDEDYS